MEKSKLIRAYAGSGKTSRLLHLMRESLDQGRSAFFVVYNKAAATETQMRARLLDIPQDNISTLHSFGFKICRQKRELVKVSEDIWYDSLGDFLQEQGLKHTIDKKYNATFWELTRYVLRMVRQKLVFYEKASLQERRQSFIDFLENEGLSQVVPFRTEEGTEYNLDLTETIPEFHDWMMEKLLEQRPIDFIDMLYVPLVTKAKAAKKYQDVFVDEAQDTNPLRQLFCEKKVAKKGSGRLIFAGDPYQTLYLFQGASIGGLDSWAERLNAEVEPMPMSRRCSTAVGAYVQGNFLSDFQVSETANEGNVTGPIPLQEGREEIIAALESSQSCAVIAREWSTLGEVVRLCLGNGLLFTLEGSHIANKTTKHLKNLLYRHVEAKQNTLGKQDLLFLLMMVDDYKNRYLRSLHKYSQQPSLIANHNDSISLIKILLEQLVQQNTKEITKKDLEKYIKTTLQGSSIKSPSKVPIAFTSIHSAKGREWDTVVLLTEGQDFVPSSGLDFNLYYTGMTRARENLVLITEATDA